MSNQTKRREAEHSPDAKSCGEHYLKQELYRLVREDPQVFDFLQNGCLDGIWYWDLEKPVHEWMSSRFWQMLGYSPEDKPHLAEAWQDIIDPGDLELTLENLQRHRDDPKHPYDQVVRLRHKDGSTVWVRSRGLAIRNEDGVPIRMLGAHTEVTQLKETEARLTKQNKKLERVNAELERFAYVTSHDLREPLRTIERFLQILQQRYQDKLDAEANELIEFAVDGASRMQSLIEDIMEFSRAGTPVKNPAPTDCNAVVDQVIASLGNAIEESGARITRDSLPTVLGDAAQLGRLWQNILANAIKFRGEEPPRIHISTLPGNDEWVFSTSDNGVGIEPQYVEQVFDMFHRAHSGYAGTGIGLAICKRIVQQHGGRIWVESLLGVGTTFFFSIRSPEDGAEGSPQGAPGDTSEDTSAA